MTARTFWIRVGQFIADFGIGIIIWLILALAVWNP